VSCSDQTEGVAGGPGAGRPEKPKADDFRADGCPEVGCGLVETGSDPQHFSDCFDESFRQAAADTVNPERPVTFGRE